MFKHVIFWSYFAAMLFCFSSIVSSIVLYIKCKYMWIRRFVLFQAILFLMLLTNSCFFFIQTYMDGAGVPLARLQLSLLAVLTLALFMVLLDFVLELIGYRKTKPLKAVIYMMAAGISVYWCIDIALQKERVGATGCFVAFSLFMLLFLLPILFRNKIQEKSKAFLLLFFVLSLLAGIVQMFEFTIRGWDAIEQPPIPLGFVTFALYGVVFGVYSLVSNGIRYFRAERRAPGFLPATVIADYRISKREQEIIGLQLQGLSHKEIAEDTFLSIRTVNSHVYNIYRKCGISSIGELFNLIRNH
jgi:DNA-binding CsgD family transcriptional regulator